jgi:hypothetical protein
MKNYNEKFEIDFEELPTDICGYCGTPSRSYFAGCRFCNNPHRNSDVRGIMSKREIELAVKCGADEKEIIKEQSFLIKEAKRFFKNVTKN